MKDKELIYLAGFLDGEGSIMIGRQIKPKQKSPYFNLRITIVNTNEKVMNWIQNITRGTIVNRRINHPKWKKIITWRIRERKAENLLKILLPYLIVKKQQAKLGLKFQNFRHSLPNNGYRGRTKRELKQLYRYYNKMKSLNKRGR